LIVDHALAPRSLSSSQPPIQEVVDVYVRVVRFTNASREQIDAALTEIGKADGPPEGVPATRLQFLVDYEAGTVVVLQHYDTPEAMAEGARILDAMDPSETPGKRTSVDACEQVLEIFG
jgi:hypothetical protein